MKKLFIFLSTFCFVVKIHPGLFSSYEKKSHEENIQDLSIEQINNPTDPYINYNLGVALYQTQKYEAAKNNFERSVAHSRSTNLKERSLFNLANSCYKNALLNLPVNWEDEKTQIDHEKLNKAIEETKSAIKNYESLLDLNKENLMAKTNLKKAKDLLEKLKKKEHQQKQDNQDQKKQNNSPETKPEKQQEQKPQESEQQKDQNKSQESSDQEQKGQKQDPENKQEQSDKKQDPQHDKTPSDEQPQKKDSQQEQIQDNTIQQKAQMQESLQRGEEKESTEQKAMRSMLENLQNEEENLQKAIILRQTKDQKPLQPGQKPW